MWDKNNKYRKNYIFDILTPTKYFYLVICGVVWCDMRCDRWCDWWCDIPR